jgi:hypothetical protein
VNICQCRDGVRDDLQGGSDGDTRIPAKYKYHRVAVRDHMRCQMELVLANGFLQQLHRMVAVLRM